ncbi:MAG: T9SS type A sorting domain-containing protein [Saprospiraceae bacterium]|nr:T9SS type A sorting domain-containing protein [Saprospiraceae bacterium]
MACNSLIQVSLDANCQATVTAAMMLNDTLTACPSGQFTVRVLKYDIPIPTSPVVTGAYVGETLKVEIRDNISGNRCWGYAKIEDKLPPTIECARDTIPCFVASTYAPYAYDGCGLDTVILTDELIMPLNCDNRYIKQVVRKYVAYDIWGNKSPVCSDTILLKRFDTARVICPESHTIALGNAINCKDIQYNRIPLDKNGHPHPDYTGVPQYSDTVSKSPLIIETIDIWPVRDIYCNIAVTYEDIDLGVINCVQKYMRMWTIREWWCNSEVVRVCMQFIEVVDREAPYVHAPYDFEATTDGGYKCQATVNIPPAIVFDSCNNRDVRVDLVYPGGIKNNSNGGVVVLPVGVNKIYYRAYDKCYNLGVDSILVTVLDKTAPVAICDRETVVSLSIYGTTHVYAKTFDDGSYDDCHIDSFLVRRMDNGAPCGQNITWFRPYVEFCCADVGQTRTVIFRAKDKHGNYNDCMVQIEVQDKIKPTCHPPKDLTVSCDFHFDINDLSVFGVMQTDSAYFNKARSLTYKGAGGVPVTVNFHDGFAHDNCEFDIDPSHVDYRTQCNVGSIVRTWVVSDGNGSETCTQTITFVNFNPYNFSNIWWPRDTTLYMCLDPDRLTPDSLGLFPILHNETKCDLLGISSQDHLFRIVQGGDACYKIIRKWKVIDWCQVVYTPSGAQFQVATHDQIIKVNNLVDPTLDAIPTQDTTVCTLDSCTNGFISLVAHGSDDCTPGDELAWEYLIDLGNNGTFDIIRSGVGNFIDATGRYPLGTHKIKYVFEDRCGNKTAEERLFTILNCKEPTPYCINGVAIDLMPLDTNRDGRIDWGMIEVWANDVDQGSYGACKNPIVLSFSSDTNNRSIVFDCNTLGQQTVQMWVTDRLTGKQAYCRTFIEVQDNNKACGQTLQSGTINGLVSNREDNQSMNDVEVSLVDQNSQGKPTVSKVITTSNGQYAFSNMPLNNGNYNVVASRNADPLNGVSTADIVKIQRHILGIETLTSPYKTIAADVNNDLNITSKDIVELRRLILGINSKFANNESWAFVDAAYQFSNAGDEVLKEKWPRSYKIDPFNKDMNGIDFKGIKIGDITGNATAGFGAVTTRGNNTTLELITQEMTFTSGLDVVVPVSVLNNYGLTGMQFTIQFDPKVLEFVDVQSAACSLNQDHLGLVALGQGLVTLSWNTNVDFDVNNGDKLFTLKFKALSQGNLSNALQFNSIITPALAFNAEVEDMDLKLGFRNQNGTVKTHQGIIVYQNQPNPFSEFTIVGYELPDAAQATITVYDLNSKVLHKSVMNATKGYNQFELNTSQLGATGVLFYQLDAAGYTATKRMVVIK